MITCNFVSTSISVMVFVLFQSFAFGASVEDPEMQRGADTDSVLGRMVPRRNKVFQSSDISFGVFFLQQILRNGGVIPAGYERQMQQFIEMLPGNPEYLRKALQICCEEGLDLAASYLIANGADSTDTFSSQNVFHLAAASKCRDLARRVNIVKILIGDVQLRCGVEVLRILLSATDANGKNPIMIAQEKNLVDVRAELMLALE